MHILNDRLKQAYHHVKAAEVVSRINTVVKEHHDLGESPEAPKEDRIAGVPESMDNRDETSPATPTEHNQPKDPEFHTDQIITGTGDGPVMESNSRRYAHR